MTDERATAEALAERVAGHLGLLTAFPDRHVGGPGNRAATALFAEEMASLGLRVSRSEMPCVEWLPGEASIEMGAERFDLHVGPYSLPCDVTAPLVAVSDIGELEREEVRGSVVLLHGEIAAGQIMPRNFTFYNPESHKRIIRALDEFRPAAIV
ncbi:MAG: hypothetical protein Q8M66_09035, partial [Actinomycetota bacterium]|nr:hypothetical protein [Actinomycetota bacterium]